ncbi:hypothetical protein NMY22_g4934 [Coprinellus aureogranulatus]|nr:hypothetical protein NMY22_g4934 [Coprinellus aureogranulatus]
MIPIGRIRSFGTPIEQECLWASLHRSLKPILHSWSLNVLRLTLRRLCHSSLDNREPPGTHKRQVQVRFTSDTDDGAEARGRSRLRLAIGGCPVASTNADALDAEREAYRLSEPRYQHDERSSASHSQIPIAGSLKRWHLRPAVDRVRLSRFSPSVFPCPPYPFIVLLSFAFGFTAHFRISNPIRSSAEIVLSILAVEIQKLSEVVALKAGGPSLKMGNSACTSAHRAWVPVPPTGLPAPPTVVPVPPTSVPIPPTVTPIPPTEVPIPPSEVPIPPLPVPSEPAPEPEPELQDLD